MATHKFRILARIFQPPPPSPRLPRLRLRPNLPEVTCLGNPSSSTFLPSSSSPFLSSLLGILLVLSACPRLTLSLSPLFLEIVSLNHPPFSRLPPRRGTPRRLSNCSTLRLNYLKPPLPSLKLVSDRREKNDARWAEEKNAEESRREC